MMKSNGGIRYIVELFIMLIIMIFVITILVTAFVKSGSLSTDAADLTEAVSLAESIAEISDTCADDAECMDRLKGTSLMSGLSIDGGVITGTHGDDYSVELSRTEKNGDGGVLVLSEIKVSHKGGSEPVYTLDTGNYLKGADND
ncbi:MAG: hypothetical protein IJH51_00555 [Christensenellaceae bacterium]|nr:hypothetical protein [Christensenellaceae bacterium]